MLLCWPHQSLILQLPGPYVWGLCFCVLGIRKCLEGSEEPSWGRKVDFPVTGHIFYTPTRCSELG